MIPLIELTGDTQVMALASVLVGIIFGIAAQRSRFCLRAATFEFANGIMGKHLTVYGRHAGRWLRIGAGVTDGSIFVTTAWLALLYMWFGAIIATRIINGRNPVPLAV